MSVEQEKKALAAAAGKYRGMTFEVNGEDYILLMGVAGAYCLMSEDLDKKKIVEELLERCMSVPPKKG